MIFIIVKRMISKESFTDPMFVYTTWTVVPSFTIDLTTVFFSSIVIRFTRVPKPGEVGTFNLTMMDDFHCKYFVSPL